MYAFYIDVYFLINFSIDILSIFFSSKICKISIKTGRLLIIGAIGAISAILNVFYGDNIIIFIINFLLFFVCLFFLVATRVSVYRRLKIIFTFALVQLIMGGVVYFGYNLLDKYLYPYVKDTEIEVENRKLILLSLMVLLMIGIIKLVIAFLTSYSEGKAKIEIVMFGRSIVIDALVDSGNIAKDPMDMSSIIIVKRKNLINVFPELKMLSMSPEDIDSRMVNRIRLVPLHSLDEKRMHVGFKADYVYVIGKNKKDCVDATIILDDSEGNYGGFFAIAPLSIIENVS